MKEQLLHALVEKSPTAWHVVETLSNYFQKNGVQRIKENSAWKLQAGNSYMFERDGSLIVFRMPKKKLSKAITIASHTDSPCLKLKPQGQYQQTSLSMLNFEPYGSPILASWVGRPLYLSGKIVVQKTAKSQPEVMLVNFRNSPFIIPNIAIHLDREVNDKGLKVAKQEGLSAIFEVEQKDQETFKYLLEKEIGKVHAITHFELFAHVLEGINFLGAKQNLLCAPRMDNLASVVVCAEAFCESKISHDTVQLAIFWNHEEIGSETYAGAKSPLFDEVLERICSIYKFSREEFFIVKSNSITYSWDVCHGVHPNFRDRQDSRHEILFGQGPAIKTHANMRYSTDCEIVGRIFEIARKEKIHIQKYAGHNDIPAGSTIGPLHAARSGVRTVDIGIPLLGMHAACELIDRRDIEAAKRLSCSLLSI